MTNWKKFQALFGNILLFVVILTVAACGGGGSSSNPATPTPGPTPTPTPLPGPAPAAAITVQADAGSICETYVSGSSGSQPLSCNNSNTGKTKFAGNTDPNTAYLDGSNSTSSDGSALTYAWTMVSQPDGSTVQLSDTTIANPTFIPDVAGTYVVQLVVSTTGVTSQPSLSIVLARNGDGSTPQYPSHGGMNHDCTFCHNDNNITLRAKSTTHIASSNVCVACHAQSIMAGDYNVVPTVDHNEVFGTCSSCHDGVIATGKSATHITTDQECDVCHTTTSFFTLTGDGKFDHSLANGPCSSCHNGVIAIGTSSDAKGHIAIGSTECNACHTTASFKTPFVDHSTSAVVGQCSDCHDPSGLNYQTGYTIPPTTHPVTTGIQCDVCHDVTGFKLNGVFDHSVLARHPLACNACHDASGTGDNTNATGVPAPTATFTHVDVSAGPDCGACHTTLTFNPAFTVDHSQFSAATDCAGSTCHDGKSVDAATGFNIPGKPSDPVHDTVTDGFCGVCHTPPGGSFLNATVDHSGYNASTVCSNCHDGTFATGMPNDTTHTTSTDAMNGLCGACHNPQSDTFAGGTFSHTGIDFTTTTCASCHDGTTAKGKSGTHIPTPNGMDCKTCHGSSNFANFTVASFDHTVLGAISSCMTCHDGQQHDSVVVIAKPKGHIPTDNTDCSVCHTHTDNGTGINGTQSSGFAFTPDLFANKVHPAYTMGCKTCHNGNSSYVASPYNATFYNTNPISTTHTTVQSKGWDCNACHSTTGKFGETNPVNHATIDFTTTTCISCHADWDSTKQTAPYPIGRDVSVHPDIPNTTICQNCHAPGGSFTAAFDHTTLDPPNGVNVGLACTTCHDGLNATGKPQTHLPTNRDCVNCHADHPPTATTFAGGTLDHHTAPEVTKASSCSSCHGDTANILNAVHKPAGHVATTADCASCHSVDAWKPATGFDHSGTTNNCQTSGCHTANNPDVTDVTDDPYAKNGTPHIPIVDTSLSKGTYPTQEIDCANCHLSPGGTFANTSMNHTPVTSVEDCIACHDGKHDGQNSTHTTTKKSANHFVTALTTCGSNGGCHTSTADWTKVSHSHTVRIDGSVDPGKHSTKVISSCTQCHTDSPAPKDTIKTYDNSGYAGYCAGCHASNFNNAGHHSGDSLSSYKNCSRCHSVSKTNWQD